MKDEKTSDTHAKRHYWCGGWHGTGCEPSRLRLTGQSFFAFILHPSAFILNAVTTASPISRVPTFFVPGSKISPVR